MSRSSTRINVRFGLCFRVVVAVVLSLGSKASVAQARQGQLPWPWPGWDHIATATWGFNNECCKISPFNTSCCNGIDTPTEARYKSQFDVVFLDNGIGTPGCRFAFPGGGGGNDTMASCHKVRSADAAAIKAVSPSTPVFTYRQINPQLEGCDVHDPALAPLLLTRDDRGSELGFPLGLDWRRPEAAAWYLRTVLGPATATDPHFDGVFIDGPILVSQKACSPNMTLGSKRALLRGVAAMLRGAARLLAAHGKVLTASLGAHYNTSALAEFYPPRVRVDTAVCERGAAEGSMEACCAGGEGELLRLVGEAMFAPFRQFNLPSRDFGEASHGGNDTLGCAAMVEDAAEEMARGPGFYTNNDGWPYNRTDGGRARRRHTASLAAYLLGAAEDSYFASGLHWLEWVPGTSPPRRAWPYWEDYRRPLGRPLEAYARSGFVFARRFEHATVTLDCRTITGTVDWSAAPTAAAVPGGAGGGGPEGRAWPTALHRLRGDQSPPPVRARGDAPHRTGGSGRCTNVTECSMIGSRDAEMSAKWM